MEFSENRGTAPRARREQNSLVLAKSSWRVCSSHSHAFPPDEGHSKAIITKQNLLSGKYYGILVKEKSKD
jgi:hypothetical protein